MVAVHRFKNANHARLLASLVGVAAMLGACAVDDAPAEAPESAEGRLLASLDLPNQRSLRFHEPQEGTVITTEQGSIASAGPSDPVEQGLNPVELYEYLSHRPAPTALVEALARTQPSGDGRRAAGVPQSLVQVPAQGTFEKDVVSAGIPGERGWFDAALCKPTDRNHLWKGVTGDSSVRTTGTNYFKTGAYAVNGIVTFRVHRYDCGVRQCDLQSDPDPRAVDSDPRYYTLTTGTYAWARIDCKNCTAEAKITNADGDVYDFCTNFHY